MSSVFFSDAFLTKANAKLAFALSASILLSACGSGGGSDTAEVESTSTGNQAPEVVEQVPDQVAAVQIFSHPQNTSVLAGQPAQFSVAASGGGSLRYQWLKNARAIEGATSSSFQLAQATLADAGVYSVVVSNSAGSQSSLTAVLSVANTQGPVVGAPPSVETPVVETPVNETPVAETPVVGTPVVETPVVETPVVETPVIENPVVENPVVENPVVETPVVETPVVEGSETVESLAIVTQPVSQIIEEADSVNLSIQVSGGSELAYQWLKDGAIIDGANASSLVIQDASMADAGDYSVVITSTEGVTLSDVATLIVNENQTMVALKSISLSWQLPEVREDGSSLETYEINGYVIAYGTNAGNLNQQITINGAQVLETVVENLSQGTYYFAIATVDSDGAQSAYSPTIQQTI